MANLTVALIHSPILDGESWDPVATELRRRGHTVIVPDLHDQEASGPFWQRHATAAGDQLRGAIGANEPTVLAGHSGAGPLLPAIAAASGGHPAGYLFVDAGVPRDGASRLDLLADELGPRYAAAFRRALAEEGPQPLWSHETLGSSVPDSAVRTAILAALRPMPLAYYDEPIPVPTSWPSAPCAYLRLSSGYEAPAAWARAAGWPVARREGSHFDLLLEPRSVANAIEALFPR
jgi:hypothetical protein